MLNKAAVINWFSFDQVSVKQHKWFYLALLQVVGIQYFVEWFELF